LLNQPYHRFLLHHFYLLYASLILFSAAELIAGLCLMTGFSRGRGAGPIGLSVVLMLMFGWQGRPASMNVDRWRRAIWRSVRGR